MSEVEEENYLDRLRDRVIEDLKEQLNPHVGGVDATVLYELLKYVPAEILISTLSEEEEEMEQWKKDAQTLKKWWEKQNG